MAKNSNVGDPLGLLRNDRKFGDVFGITKKKSLKKQLDELIANRPKYEIADEYDENQALAKMGAFGRDRSIMQAEENIQQQAADAIGQAQEVSASSSGILNTLASIGTGTNQALRNLASDEAAIQGQRMQDLYSANVAMGEEKDKEWDYNVNEPYQNKIQELRLRRKARQENLWKILDVIGAIGGSAAGAAVTGGMK